MNDTATAATSLSVANVQKANAKSSIVENVRFQNMFHVSYKSFRNDSEQVQAGWQLLSGCEFLEYSTQSA